MRLAVIYHTDYETGKTRIIASRVSFT